MPKTLDPNSSGTRNNASLKNIDHGYDYPEGLNLRPGHELHDKIVSQVIRYAQDSHDYMSKRHGDWREIDKVLKSYTYVPTMGGSRDKAGTDSQGDEEDSMRRVIMPASQVILETLLTYFSQAFLQSPIFNYEGTGPEDVFGGKMLTAVIDKQNHTMGNALSLHTAWRDMFAYGVGYATPIWHEQLGRVVMERPTGILDTLRAQFIQTGREKVLSEYKVLFEGNKIVNIDPYLALPDVTVSAHEVQQGEYFGWVDEGTLTWWLREEAGPGGDLFNMKYLRDLGGNLTSVIKSQGERNKSRDSSPKGSDPVDIIWMYVDIFPEAWGLPGGDNPETWVFGVAADKILVKAERLNLAHGQIPVACGAPDFDGYTAAPMSRLMSIEELQMLMDFLYTSHVENIKRVLNDSIVYDPTLINTFDLNDNRPGKRIRLRKRAWGKGGIKDNAIFQLDVRDVTQQNVQEALFLMEQARSSTSTMENLSGSIQPRTSRISASEVQGARMSGLSRLERPAQLVSHQFMLPLARMMASNVQQFMSQEVYIKTTGEMEDVLREEFGKETERGRFKVDPFSLLISYDVVAHDGAVPGKEDVRIWTDLFQILGQNPELAQNFDITKVFKHIAREMGAKNIDQFVRRRRPQVMPDEQVQQELQQGNLQPLNGQV